MSYNLVKQPWIAVRTLGHGYKEVSLRQVFHSAGEIRGLGGELASQDSAILRLLIAIIARSVAGDRTDDEAASLWDHWWRNKELPIAEIDTYLDSYEARFDLFDPVVPFMQVPGMQTSSGSTSGLVKLIAEVPDGHKYFSLRQGSGLEGITPSEAARWLVHAHAFDTSGIKTGIVGDARVKGGRAYPMGTGYTGNLGIVFAEGESLLETLLLNLLVGRCVPTDSAPWERPPDGVGPSLSHPAPHGMADLFTWQSRRILLLTTDLPDEGTKVTDAMLTYGDPIRPENRHVFETMSAFKLSSNLSKREKRDVYWPIRHNPGRSIWRGLGALAAQESTTVKSIPPPVIDWLNARREDEILDDRLIRLHVVGVEYGSNDSTFARLIDDTMTGHVSAFTSSRLQALAVRAVVVAGDGATAYVHLRQRLVEAAGGDPRSDSSAYFTTAYAALDPVFREWFSALTDDLNEDDAEAEWHRITRAILSGEGDRAIADAGATSLRGKVSDSVTPSISRFKILDAASIRGAFVRELAARTPLASQPIPAQEVQKP